MKRRHFIELGGLSAIGVAVPLAFESFGSRTLQAQVPISYGKYISLSSINFPDRFIRHMYFHGELTPIVSELDKNDATFEIVKGLADSRFISFRSVNFPNHYLRHQGFRLKLHELVWIREPGSFGRYEPLFAKDATFLVQKGNSDAAAVSFASFNFRDRFIRHKNFHLFLEPLSDAISYQDSTFKIEPGFIPTPPEPVIR